ncbi:MAG: hypothetical protein AAB116_18085 [Candidatus Poribacteria bacterium]
MTEEEKKSCLNNRKRQQIEAFRKIHGIWKDRNDIDEIFKEIDERWKQWGRDLDKMIEHWHNYK